MNEEKEDEKPESKTLQYLRKAQDDRDNVDDFNKTIDRLTNYTVDDDGFTLLKKDEKTGERRKLTQDEIDEIVTRKNTENVYDKKSHYDISPEGTIYTVDNKDESKRKILNKKYRSHFLKKLNDEVNDLGKHYKYKGDSATLQVNASEYVDDGTTGNDKFDRLEYKDIDGKDIELILSKVNKSKENKRAKDVIGYENGHFTQNGKEMTQKQFDYFVKILNGQIGGTTKLINPKAWGKKEEDYWKSYKISIAGSKVGNAINFNLPPVETCHKGDLPCAKLCYAVKAYAAKPAVRGATKCNFELLKRDKNFELFKKSIIYALSTPLRGNKGKKFTLCRIHVSGDFYSTDYLKAICDVARECSWVKFWMYTKQYEMLSEVGKSYIPDNLCVIVSCWGKYNPFDYQEGKYKELAKDFPLAYLDDGSEEFKAITEKTQELLGKPKDVQYCPCTVADQIITRCETCEICFNKLKANENLVFKLH